MGLPELPIAIVIPPSLPTQQRATPTGKDIAKISRSIEKTLEFHYIKYWSAMIFYGTNEHIRSTSAGNSP
jgi:hypothetical protein